MIFKNLLLSVKRDYSDLCHNVLDRMDYDIFIKASGHLDIESETFFDVFKQLIK